jgi:uncharacterized protein DUF3883
VKEVAEMAKPETISIEKRVLKVVKKYEKANGRQPKRSTRRGTGYDIESSGRKIEVKTIPRIKSGFVKLGERQFRTLCRDKHFWLYLVTNERKPRIMEFPRNEALAKIDGAHVSYDFVFSKGDLKSKASRISRKTKH